MSGQHLSWSGLQLLVAVRAAGSMLGAARHLGLAASTVGRRLDALEEQVGARLVERGPHGIRLTPAGEALALCGAQVQLSIARTLRELPLPGQALSGTIRISAGDGFAAPILEAIEAMACTHPAVRFELALEDRPVDLSRREADVAVRTIHHRESTLVYSKLGALPYGVFASPGYLAAHGRPDRPAAPGGHRWIGLAPPLDRQEASLWLAAQVGVPPTLLASTFYGLLSAAHAGLGLAALPIVASSGLIRVWPERDLPSLPIWLVVHRDARTQPHIAAFLQPLRSALVARMEA